MSWRIAVRHRTGYHYSTPVRASYNEARMTPASSRRQHTLESRLDISPGSRPLRYVDYWGTVVDAFDVHVAHTELVVTASAVVETAGALEPVHGVGWDTVTTDQMADRYAELLGPSRFVSVEAEVATAGQSLAAELPPVEAGLAAVAWSHDQLGYERGQTGVHTTSAQARAAGKGVCQDYSHLALAALRAMRLPARYVSGYLYPIADDSGGKSDRNGSSTVGATTRGESHAWVEFWAGDWVAADPTSLDAVGERHIVVARGRDYADVRPLSGVYHGPPAESLGVTVELTRLR
ncbi:MAG: transglutaminase family protein [Actinomycetota bacterium]|nr:transglutaminase family protein [Actinomycetota bacterium]